MSTLSSFSSGVHALVRTGRHGETSVNWSAPFVCPLYLQKDRNGQLVGLALQGRDFAEFDPRHDTQGDLLFISEDYVLEILEIPAAQ